MNTSSRIGLLAFVSSLGLSLSAWAAWQCCSLDSVALCGDKCCKTECASDGTCPDDSCPDGQEKVSDGECCDSDMVQESGSTTTCYQCPSQCDPETATMVDNYCTMMFGEKMGTILECARKKSGSSVTIGDHFSSFSFEVSGQKYNISLDSDNIFCGNISKDSINIKRSDGNKICYNEIDTVVDEFVSHLMNIKDNCVNDTFLYQFIDIKIQVNKDIPKWAKTCWKGCIFDGMKDLVISSSLKRGLKEFFKDYKNQKYCNTPDCMKVCCGDYEEDSSGNPIVTKTCCDSINGDYHELDGNRVDCCTKGSSSVASFDIFDFAKELFLSKTAYAESPQCIVSCKKGYEKVVLSCCKPDDTTCICEDDPDDERCNTTCQAGGISKGGVCCLGNYAWSKYNEEYTSVAKECGCPNGGVWSDYLGTCCSGEFSYRTDGYTFSDADCLCTNQENGRPVTKEISGSSYRKDCYVCDGQGASEYVMNNQDYDENWKNNREDADAHKACCTALGGSLCEAEGVERTYCILNSDYKCCVESDEEGYTWISINKCCSSDIPDKEKASCYSCESGSWVLDHDARYSGESRLIEEDIYLYGWVYDAGERFNCGTGELLGIYDGADDTWLASSWEDFEERYGIYF